MMFIDRMAEGIQLFSNRICSLSLKADSQCRATRELFHARAAATAMNLFLCLELCVVVTLVRALYFA